MYTSYVYVCTVCLCTLAIKHRQFPLIVYSASSSTKLFHCEQGNFRNSRMDDLTKARHISEIIVSCCLVNPPRNYIYEIGFGSVFACMCHRDVSCVDLSGSCAEFYVVPAVMCVGDIDIMLSLKNNVAVCAGKTLKYEDLNETANVWRIETSECPIGYVHLRLLGSVTYSLKREQFEFFKYPGYCLFERPSRADLIDHGPAQVTQSGVFALPSADVVACIRVPAWPSVAKSWISRDRNYEWPCRSVISEVAWNGCDLVLVAHRDYKQDSCQMRYSFSRAEVTLIRSWTPIQQIVYNMLRYVVKLEIIREWKNDDKVICTYHIKTLMLWACERKSPVWWESNCVLELCSKLLDTLMKWIIEKHCPHYFIPEWNLLDFTMKESRYHDTIETLRILVDIRYLSEWFRINYVSKVFVNYQLTSFHNCEERQQALDTFAASSQFDENFYEALQEWVVDRIHWSLLHMHSKFSNVMLNQHSHENWLPERFSMLIALRKVAPAMQCSNLGVVSLRLAWNISRKKESELSYHELLDVLSKLVLRLSGQDTWSCRTPHFAFFKQCSKWYFFRGVRLLSAYCTQISDEFRLWVKTCKLYFKSALGIQDEYSESIHDACHVYLSALYYVSGTNQERTIKHLMGAKNGRFFDNSSKPYIMDYCTLLFVDEVAQACGFYFLCGHVVHNQEMLSAKGFNLTTVVLCLIILILRVNNRNSSIEIDRMRKTKPNSTSPLEICLWTISAHKYCRRTQTDFWKTCNCWSSIIPNNSAIDGEEIQVSLEDSLEKILVKLSVNLFTQYYKLEYITLAKHRFPYLCGIVSHFKALYYYREGDYVKLLKTCDSIISYEIFQFASEEGKHPRFLLNRDYHKHGFLSISVLYSFQTLFRNDVVFLTGLINLLGPKWSIHNERNFRENMQILDSNASMREFVNRESLKFHLGKIAGCQHPLKSSKISPLFLVYYLRFQSLYQLNYPKSAILSAMNDLKHARVGFVFEDILLLFVGLTLKRLHWMILNHSFDHRHPRDRIYEDPILFYRLFTYFSFNKLERQIQNAKMRLKSWWFAQIIDCYSKDI